ncbi:MAG: hypothetical protein U5K37_07640 [Natrialbaceae archaeon]|nr:hypothetical protein [Natrialbaceae archaeon]
MASALLGFAVIPMGSGVHLADPEVGLVFVFAIASVTYRLVDGQGDGSPRTSTPRSAGSGPSPRTSPTRSRSC